VNGEDKVEEKIEIKLPEGRKLTDELSPIDYFPGTELRARRMCGYISDEVRFISIDYIIVDDTRYMLYIDVSPDYRETGEWQRIFEEDASRPEYVPFTSKFFGVKNIVWVQTSREIAEKKEELLQISRTLSKESTATFDKVYVYGAVNEIVDLKDEESQ
jgi:hypothetical protein